MTERQFPKTEITPESLPQLRRVIGSLREEKGKETEALELTGLVRRQAILLAEHEHVVNLYWEEHLIGQHMAMIENSKPERERSDEKIAEGLRLMEEATIKAHGYIQAHGVSNLEPRSYRFLGRVADYKGDCEESKRHYQKAIGLFEGEEEPLTRVNRLEIQGFLAYSMVMLGEIEEGLNLGMRTFKEFDDLEEGKKKKDADYFEWAVWKSGIPIRLYGALIEKRVDYDKEEMDRWLGRAEEILVIPEDDETWGDKNFQFRKDEIEAIRRRLS